MQIQWETELAGLLNDLCATQDELIGVLTEKRGLLVAADTAGMLAMQGREQELLARLQSCHQRRGELLAQAAAVGLPSDSIRSLAASLPVRRSGAVNDRVQEAASRARLLQHHSLTNWVLAQRTLLHLSQLLEIIATGGRLRPTYGKAQPVDSSGSLVDQAA